MGHLVDMERDRAVQSRDGGRRARRRENRSAVGIGNTCGGLTAGLPPLLMQTTTHNKDGTWARNGVRLSAKVMMHGLMFGANCLCFMDERCQMCIKQTQMIQCVTLATD